MWRGRGAPCSTAEQSNPEHGAGRLSDEERLVDAFLQGASVIVDGLREQALLLQSSGGELTRRA
jgi:hypothetical protein